jgi:hypothetical protein
MRLLLTLTFCLLPYLVSANQLEDLHKINELQTSLQTDSIIKSIELASQIKDNNLRSIWAINVLIKTLDKDDLALSFQTIELVTNQDLKSIWAVNILVKALANDDIAASFQAIEMISNTDLKDVWLANIILKSLGKEDCESANLALEQISSNNLKNVYKIGLSQKCSSIIPSLSTIVGSVTSSVIQKSDSNNEEISTKKAPNLESGELTWVCGSKDKDGLSPYAIFRVDQKSNETAKTDAVFGKIEHCNKALKEPLSLPGKGQFFCASKDEDGLNPNILFKWISENDSRNGLQKLTVVNGEISDCELSIENSKLREGNLFICGSKDKDGLSPYAIFNVLTGETSGGDFNSLSGCIKSM